MQKSEITVWLAAGIAALTVIVIIGQERFGAERPESSESNLAYPADLKSNRVELENFTGISAHGNWQVTITQGDEWQVDLSYPDDIKDRLWVRAEGDRLVLGRRSNSWQFWNSWGSSHSAPTARIVMPALDALKVSGAGKLQFHGFSGDRLTIRVSGAGKIDGTGGSFDQLTLTASGAGDANMRDIVFTDARTRLSGAGKVSLTMDGGVLSGRISGAGKVVYSGSVSDERVTISGDAIVRHED